MYKARKIEYLIAKMFVKLNYVGLANIIFERENLPQCHKEYLQKFDIETNFISDSAKEKIEKLGGKVTLIK
jgi:lipid-A-disaccharide synthase